MKMYLPLGWEPRPEQQRLYDEIVEAFDDYSIVFLGAPTGIGKSAIARALLEVQHTGLVITATKQLQEQYTRDFPEMPRLLGRSNFDCHGMKYGTCEKGFYRALKGKKKKSYCRDCPYKEHVDFALGSNYFVANYASAMWTARNDDLRGLLIIDEGHRAETELMGHLSVHVSEDWMEKTGTELPEDPEDDDELFDWIDLFLTDLKSYRAATEDNAETDRMVTAVENLADTLDDLKWVPTCVNDRMFGNYVEYKPLKVTRRESNKLLSKADKIVMMSATILNPGEMARSLGIREEEWIYLNSNEAFDPETRLVLYFSWSPPVTHGTYEDTKDIIAETIQEILDQHPDDKGLIHTSSTKLASYINATVDDPRLLLAHGKGRTRAFETHVKSEEPTVLLSPSMTEGVDLRDDLARFIIIAKAPFMSLGDRQVAQRTQIDDEWYKMHTIRQIIQSCGRGTRSEDDSCVTYVLDSKVFDILSENQDVVPKWFWDAWVEVD